MSSYSEEKSSRFYWATRKGDLSQVQALSQDPEVNLNWKDKDSGDTAFLYACLKGHVDIVRFMLDFSSRPIEYNLTNASNSSPFLYACHHGREKVVEMLLSDERIDVNLVNRDGESPFWMASKWGNLGVVKLLVASKRAIETEKRDKRNNQTAMEIAREYGNDAVALLEEFYREPELVRARVRRELATSGGSASAQVSFRPSHHSRSQSVSHPIEPETQRKMTLESEIAHLKIENDRQNKEIERQKRDNERQDEEIEELKRLVAELMKK